MPPKIDPSRASATQNSNASTESTGRFSAFKQKVISTLKSILHLPGTASRPIGQRGVKVGSPPKKSPLKELTNADYFKGHDKAEPSLVKKNLGIRDVPGLSTNPAFKTLMGDMQKLLADDTMSPASKQDAFKDAIAPQLNQLLKNSKLSYSDQFGLFTADGKAFVESLKNQIGKDVVASKKDWFEAEWKQVFDGKGASEFYHYAVIGLGETGTGNFRGTEADLEGSTIKVGKKTYVFSETIGSGAFGTTASYVRSKDELAEEAKKGIKSTGPMVLAVKIPQHDPQLGEHESLIDGPIQEVGVQFDVIGTGASAENIANAQGIVRTADGVVLTILGMAENGSLKGFTAKMKDAVDDGGLKKSSAALFKKGVARDILRGLQRLRSAVRVIHSDVAARNGLVSKDGRGMLSDFGLAKKTDGDDISGAKISKPTGKVPTRWTSPERLLNQPIDSKTDVWSFGAMLLELATGKLPFHQLATNQDVMDNVTKADFDVTPFLTDLADGDFSKEEAEQLSSLLKKIFNPNPAERPTIEEILADPFFALDEAELETARGEVLAQVGVKPPEEDAEDQDRADGYGVAIPVAYRQVRTQAPGNSSIDEPADNYGNAIPVSQIVPPGGGAPSDYRVTVNRVPEEDYNATVNSVPEENYDVTVEADPDTNNVPVVPRPRRDSDLA